MRPLDITCSIVLYKNDPKVLEKAIDSVLATSLALELMIIDNSPTNQLHKLCTDNRITYFHSPKNLGFGKGHNIAIKKYLERSICHLVLNPDVSFPKGTLEKLFQYIKSNKNIGLLLPKVYDLEKQIQPVCKRLPAPMDLIIRRFGRGYFSRLFKKRLIRYEMYDMDYNQAFEAPSISGCFMFFRMEALKKIGFFDDRFFLYMEDVDISRRMLLKYKNVYYPEAYIFHGHARESYKMNRLLITHIISAIRYFNKWGWIVDPKRGELNHSNHTYTNQQTSSPSAMKETA